MAVNNLVSIHGRDVGLDNDRALRARVAMEAPTLRLGSAGSEIACYGSSAVVAGSTATTLTAGGVTTLGATQAATYLLAAPSAGVVKRLFVSGGSTTARVVTLASTTCSILSTAGTTSQNITFAVQGNNATLIGLSATVYGYMSGSGATIS
jgi:hypothetical protein